MTLTPDENGRMDTSALVFVGVVIFALLVFMCASRFKGVSSSEKCTCVEVLGEGEGE